jgi:hypothetical protein
MTVQVLLLNTVKAALKQNPLPEEKTDKKSDKKSDKKPDADAKAADTKKPEAKKQEVKKPGNQDAKKPGC